MEIIVVALMLVFIGACADIISPLNAVQMLWVNLVMDTMGALALGTESPTPDLLNRRPYKRSATLISRPMLRNIIGQGIFQLLLLLLLMFKAPEWFGLHEGIGCLKYDVDKGNAARWSSSTGALLNSTELSSIRAAEKLLNSTESFSISCQSFMDKCDKHHHLNCYEDNTYSFATSTGNNISYISWKFANLPDFDEKCFSQCDVKDYTHGTVVFNTFIFCQVRSLETY
jgi:hypothetical protein